MPKIPLSELQDWVFATTTPAFDKGRRIGKTASGARLAMIVRPAFLHKDKLAWTVEADGIVTHTEYTLTAAAAQDAADSYLAEHFELPIEPVDELAQAKKLIAELQQFNRESAARPYLAFKPGQPVHIKGASKAATIPITCIRLYAGDTVYSLANGMSFKAHELEPA